MKVGDLETLLAMEAKKRQGTRTDIKEKFPEGDKGQARDKLAVEAKKRQQARKGKQPGASKAKFPELDEGRPRSGGRGKRSIAVGAYRRGARWAS